MKDFKKVNAMNKNEPIVMYQWQSSPDLVNQEFVEKIRPDFDATNGYRWFTVGSRHGYLFVAKWKIYLK
jgi:hypothetical protein